jgi:diaminohydroxyphosphoribosylaminopyrimidine deaminase/5-amino-6-(5-phosphoribosylamino)uracil reductase
MPKREEDSRWMEVALIEGRKGLGLTRPNPAVGAVVVKAGKQLGTGWHKKAGTPHAEVHALAAAGSGAKGATLYVTLEPCSTTGRTPPCVEAIIAAGIKRVVVGSIDPNPNHCGHGLKLLRRKKISVSTGILSKACDELIRGFSHHQKTHRPFLSLKMAMTLDGRIADQKGHSQWITGSDSRKKVQALRREVDAVLIGRETAMRDNPSLTPRPARGRKPFRVVLDRTLRVPLKQKLFTDPQAKRTLVYCGAGASATKRKALEKRGVTVIPVRLKRGQLDLNVVLKDLGKRALLHVLCEGGGQLAESLVREGLVDEAWFFVAPSFLGGSSRPVLEGKGWLMDQKPMLRFSSMEPLGADLLIRATPEGKS